MQMLGPQALILSLIWAATGKLNINMVKAVSRPNCVEYLIFFDQWIIAIIFFIIGILISVLFYS